MADAAPAELPTHSLGERKAGIGIALKRRKGPRVTAFPSAAVRARPRWSGRTAAVLGIVLLALNLRTAVAVLSPIVSYVSADIPLDGLGIGLLGTLAPLAFAASGFVAPVVARRIGMEAVIVLACVAMVVGPVVRALAPTYLVLVGGSVVTLAGMGLANILLPSVVKKYFPDRVALLTALYIGLICLSAAGPPLIAAPLAELVGWRATLGVWAVLSVGALVPWLIVLLQHRGRNPEVAPLAPSQTLPKRMHRSRVARALALAFAISTLHGYAMFAWLPALLIETAGVSPVEGGSLLALYGVLGLPLGVLAPLLVIRVRRVWVLFVATTVLYIAGYLGLLLAPGSGTWVWTVLIGGGPVAYQFCLVLIGLRTRSHEAALALSGFVQAISYAAGALGPLVIGVLRDLTDGWTVPLLFLLLTALLTLVSAVRLARPSMVEDELDS